MVVLPELNDDQRLYLQTIFDYFHREGKWPTYKYVDRKILQTNPDFDMDEVSKSLSDGFATGFAFHPQLDQEAILIVPALYCCQGAEEELADFIRVVRLCVDKFYTFSEDALRGSLCSSL